MVDDSVHHRKVRNKGDDLHRAAALRAEERVDLIHFTDHLGPALGVAGGTEAAGAAGEHKQPLLATVGTADAGKPAAGIAAIEVALHHLLDDGPKEAVFFLKAALMLGKETVEIVKEHAIEDGAFGMARAVNSWHSNELLIKKRANLGERSVFAWSEGREFNLPRSIPTTGVDNGGRKRRQPLTDEQKNKGKIACFIERR